MNNPVTSNPANTFTFPNVTAAQLTELLSMAKTKHGTVTPSTDGMSGTIAFHVFFQHCIAWYSLEPSGLLTVQVDSHADLAQKILGQAIASIQAAGA